MSSVGVRDVNLRMSAIVGDDGLGKHLRVNFDVRKEDLQALVYDIIVPTYLGPHAEMQIIRNELARRIRLHVESAMHKLALGIANEICGLGEEP